MNNGNAPQPQQYIFNMGNGQQIMFIENIPGGLTATNLNTHEIYNADRIHVNINNSPARTARMDHLTPAARHYIMTHIQQENFFIPGMDIYITTVPGNWNWYNAATMNINHPQAQPMQAPLMQAPLMQAPLMQAPPMQAPLMQAPPMQAPPMQAPQPDNDEEPTHQDNLEHLHELVGGDEGEEGERLAEQLDYFTPQKVRLLCSENFERILRIRDWAQELFNCSEQELEILEQHDIHTALEEGRVDNIAQLIQHYTENPQHFAVIVANDADDAIIDYILEHGADQFAADFVEERGEADQVVETLGNDGIPLQIALGQFDEPEDTPPHNEEEPSDDDAQNQNQAAFAMPQASSNQFAFHQPPPSPSQEERERDSKSASNLPSPKSR